MSQIGTNTTEDIIVAHTPHIKLRQCRLRAEATLTFLQMAQLQIDKDEVAQKKLELALMYQQKTVDALK